MTNPDPLISVESFLLYIHNCRATCYRCHDHITPILRQLHWLPVHQRVTFKIAVLVFQCLTGQLAGTGVPGRRLSAQHAPTAINRHSDVRRPTIK